MEFICKRADYLFSQFPLFIKSLVYISMDSLIPGLLLQRFYLISLKYIGLILTRNLILHILSSFFFQQGLHSHALTIKVINFFCRGPYIFFNFVSHMISITRSPTHVKKIIVTVFNKTLFRKADGTDLVKRPWTAVVCLRTLI